MKRLRALAHPAREQVERVHGKGVRLPSRQYDLLQTLGGDLIEDLLDLRVPTVGVRVQVRIERRRRCGVGACRSYFPQGLERNAPQHLELPGPIDNARLQVYAQDVARGGATQLDQGQDSADAAERGPTGSGWRA